MTKYKKKETRTFGTMTDDLKELKKWLDSNKIEYLAMESTGVYWKPVFNILEPSLEIFLANARHIKNVPGRKTDVKDSQWLCQLLRAGLIQASFIPSREIRNLRELTRYRKSIVGNLTAEKNRIIKILESCNIKLATVLSNVFGVTGWTIVKKLSMGILDLDELTQSISPQVKSSKQDIKRALSHTLSEADIKILNRMITNIEHYNQMIEDLSNDIEKALEEFKEEKAIIETTPGVGATTVATIIAEIGTKMDQFPSEYHIASWAGLSPGNNESAGKKKSTRINPGNKHLKVALIQAAWAAVASKKTFWSKVYWKLKFRLGGKRSIVAIARKILVAIYHMLKNKTPFREVNADEINKKARDRKLKYHLKQLRKLGYETPQLAS